MTRRESLFALIAGAFTAKAVAKTPVVALAAAPVPPVTFIASGAWLAEPNHLEDAARYALNSGKVLR